MTIPARPIIVPLDGSANAELAVPTGIRLGRILSAPVRFIRVEMLKNSANEWMQLVEVHAK